MSVVKFVETAPTQKIRIRVLTRILLVDGSAHWLWHMQAILKSEADFRLIGIASNGEEALHQARQLEPDVIVIDISLPGTSGLDVARQIRSGSARSKILFLSGHSDPDFVDAAFDAGGSGYVLKSDAAVDIVSSVRAVLANQRFISRSLAPDKRA